MIPKANRSRKPWRGLVDMQTFLLERGRLDEACHLVLRQTQRHSTKKGIIQKQFKVLAYFPKGEPEDIVLRQKLVLLEIRLRTSIASKLCDLEEFEQAKFEFSTAEERLVAFRSAFSLDEATVSKTSLSFALRLAKLETIQKNAFEERIVEYMALLRDSEDACHRNLAQCFLEAALALKSMYSKTGQLIYRERLINLVEEKENFQLNVLGDIFAPLMAHQIFIPDYDPSFNDMSDEEIEKILLWYKNYDHQYPEFNIPLVGLGVAQLKLSAIYALGDISRVEPALLEMMEWETRMKPRSEIEVSTQSPF